MKNKTNFERHLEKLSKEAKSPLNESELNNNTTLPEGEEYDIDQMINDVDQMKKDLEGSNLFMFDMDEVLEEMHDSKLHQEEDGVDQARLPNGELGYIDKETGETIRPSIDPPKMWSIKDGKMPEDPAHTDEYKTWEKGNTKINESMKIYNDQKKQSYKGEQEKQTFSRLIGYEIPEDNGRIQENKMWGHPKQLDRLVVIMDTQECLLITKENFDLDKLSQDREMNASKAGHSLNVFDQLFETWYEYSKEDFEKLL